jgi:thiamine pyrophosphate-dependent acetolactate synthase large subunit-like protein
MKVAEAIARALKAEGVEYLVCYPRQALIDPCAAVGIKPVICRQERVGVGIADGISRSTNGKKIGVFSMQGGPGTENAFAGAAQVYSDNIPVLLLPGGAFTNRTHTPPVFDAVNNFHHVTKWAANLNQAARTSEMMRRAFHQMRNGKPGPVMIEIPNDIIEAETGGDFSYTPVKSMRTGPDPDDVRTVAELLLKSDCPVIHAGQGVMFADATDELVALAELLQAPVFTTNSGKSAFPENHPLALGAFVISAPKAAFQYLRNADPLIGVGTSFSRTPWGPRVPAGKRIVHITLDAADVNKEHPTEAAILGDTKLALRALIAEIGTRKRTTKNVAADVQAIKKEWQDEWKPVLGSNDEPMEQYRIINDLAGAVDHDKTIVTHDAGSPREQVIPFWETTKPRGYLGWGKSTQLGHGLGLIMGAKLANPDKLCINFMGDASIGMVGMDLETAVRNRIGILTIVFNNGVMAGERDSMPISIEKHNALDLGGNYADVAMALGLWSKRIVKPADFLPALKDAIAATEKGTPALIECMVKQNYRFSRY